MESVDPEALILVGTIWRAHGIKGELKVIPETDDPERLLGIETFFMGATPDHAAPQAVEKARLHQIKRGTVVIVKLEGVDTREWAETMRDVNVFAHEDDLPPLEEGEVFVHDLIGLQVEDEAGEAIGTVENVITSTGHPVYVIAREGKPPAMVPAVDKFVTDVDLEARRIVIRPIEGLLE